jgi:hypothetical protein
MSDLFRVYSKLGADGYPPEWHETIKHLVREQVMERLDELLGLERVA